MPPEMRLFKKDQYRGCAAILQTFCFPEATQIGNEQNLCLFIWGSQIQRSVKIRFCKSLFPETDGFSGVSSRLR
ncbi:MAG: hypothetical protein B6245_20200 [Desulfobacteraceae bacterium 4572_88]|nr:MAG: hypothetical protein B6245_20200 [Desulfobacteraceae bacterium 4572_88]